MRMAVSFFSILALLAMPLNAEDVFALYGKVQEAWEKGDTVSVLHLVKQMVALSPGHAGIQFQYARALAANGNAEEALKTLRRIARMGGSPPARTDEKFAALKDRPEFRSLLEEFEQNRTPSGRSNVAFVVPGKDIIPEGIAYDPVDKNFYIGSTYRRKIIRVDSTGKSHDFKTEKQDGLMGLVGMEVDPGRRLLWANTANAGAEMYMSALEPETEGKTAVFKYDLRSGNLIKKYETGSKENPKFFNDVAISSSGDVYISESNTGEIFKIGSQTDTLDLLVPAGTMGFPNGLAISADDKFLYISHLEGITFIDLVTGNRQMLTGPPDSQLGNHDGMVFYKNGLIGIQGLTGGVDRIVRLHLRNPKHVEKVEVLQINHPLFALPTTGDMVGDEFYYIANSQLRSFDEKGNIFPAEKLSDTVILKVDLLESEKEELQAVHEKDREAHIKTDVNLLLVDAPAEFVTVNRGKINRVTRDEERKMFEAYFQGAVYSEYENMEAPLVFVSEDGRSGWVITRTRVKRSQDGKNQEFVYAGIMTYEKRNDKWIRTANVSTFE